MWVLICEIYQGFRFQIIASTGGMSDTHPMITRSKHSLHSPPPLHSLPRATASGNTAAPEAR